MHICPWIICVHKYVHIVHTNTKKVIDTGFDTCKSCSVDMDMMDIDVVDMMDIEVGDMVDMGMVQSSESYIFTV